MFQKGSKLYSILRGKCPRCHEGDFFVYPLSYRPGRITKIHTHCPSCQLKYMLEPSFYYGAMYVNYALTVAISILSFLISKLIFETNLLTSFGIIFLALVILAPINMRLSRILWINMFVGYKAKSISKNE